MPELETGIKSRDEWFALSALKPKSIEILNTLVAKDEVLLGIPIAKFQEKLRRGVEEVIYAKAERNFKTGQEAVDAKRAEIVRNFEQEKLKGKRSFDYNIDAHALQNFYQEKLSDYLEQLSPLEIQTILGKIIDSFRNQTASQGHQDKQPSLLRRVQTSSTTSHAVPTLTNKGMTSLGHRMDLEDQKKEQQKMRETDDSLWGQASMATVKRMNE